MKKLKSMFCGILLSTCLVGNVFAGNFTGYVVYSLFDSVVNTVVSFISGDPCQGRVMY